MAGTGRACTPMPPPSPGLPTRYAGRPAPAPAWPIHDATRHHVLYDAQRDGGRASILSIVHRILDGGDWPFLSPFMVAARDRFGHDPDAARYRVAAGADLRLTGPS